MDRQGISSPVFHDNDGANNYITKTSIFGLQRAMRGIERLTVDIHQREARTRDYIDTKLDAQLDDIRHVWANYKSSSLRESWIRGCSDSRTIPSAGLLDYEDTRLKTPSRVRKGFSLAWKASLVIRMFRSPTIVTDSM